MTEIVAVDDSTGRKYTIDEPDDYRAGEDVLLLLNLHGGGSVGAWQRGYFPASDHVNQHRLVVATPTAATKEPMRMWVGDADDAHLRAIVESLFARYGLDHVRGFWLVGHSQGGMTSRRLLDDPWWRDRVDGWLSIAGGRIGPTQVPDDFFAPHRVPGREPPRLPEGARRLAGVVPDGDFSFIYTAGEHEITGLPETSPWAEKYGAGARERLPDIEDTQGGKVYDTVREGRSNKAWGLRPGPGTAEVWRYPGASGGRVIADVIRLGKGHTEGLEPNVTEALVRMIAEAPGGKARALASA